MSWKNERSSTNRNCEKSHLWQGKFRVVLFVCLFFNHETINYKGKFSWVLWGHLLQHHHSFLSESLWNLEQPGRSMTSGPHQLWQRKRGSWWNNSSSNNEIFLWQQPHRTFGDGRLPTSPSSFALSLALAQTADTYLFLWKINSYKSLMESFHIIVKLGKGLKITPPPSCWLVFVSCLLSSLCHSGCKAPQRKGHMKEGLTYQSQSRQQQATRVF